MAQTTSDEPQTSNITNPNLKYTYYIQTTKQKTCPKITNLDKMLALKQHIQNQHKHSRNVKNVTVVVKTGTVNLVIPDSNGYVIVSEPWYTYTCVPKRGTDCPL